MPLPAQLDDRVDGRPVSVPARHVSPAVWLGAVKLWYRRPQDLTDCPLFRQCTVLEIRSHIIHCTRRRARNRGVLEHIMRI